MSPQPSIGSVWKHKYPDNDSGVLPNEFTVATVDTEHETVGVNQTGCEDKRPLDWSIEEFLLTFTFKHK